MKILIIGGTGNISSPVSEELVAKGEQVILYNRGNHLLPGARQIIGDRTRRVEFEQQMRELILKEGRLDCVIDMVAYQPEDAKSLVNAFEGKIGQLIFCSTVDVYTKPAPYFPIKEDFERIPDPRFEYAYHKAVMENSLLLAARKGAFPLTIMRPAATYNDTWAPISPIGSGTALLQRIRTGKPVIILGDGTSFWTSSHRDDVAKAFVNAASNPISFGKDYNLTGDEWMTWEAYYSTAARVMQAPPIRIVPIPADLLAKITHGVANWSSWNFKYNNIFDNSSAKADLGYCYTITWEEGVRRMVAYHDQHGGIDTAKQDPLYDRVIEVFENHVALMEEEI